MLDGWKTYIIAAVLGALSVAKYLGWVTPEAADQIQTLLLGGAFAALRAGVKKG